MTRSALGLLLALICGVERAWAQAPEKEAYAQEYYQSLKGEPANSEDLAFYGPNANQYLKFEPEGLRLTLPSGVTKAPETGLRIRLPLKGDFEATVNFDLLKEPEPGDAGTGTRFSLAVRLATADDNVSASFGRRMDAMGVTQFVAWTTPAKDTKKARYFPTPITSGRLRLVRTGERLTYYAAEGDDGDFTLLHEQPFSADDVKEVRIGGITGGPKASLDVRLFDLRVRGSLPEAAETPAVAGPQRSIGWKIWLALGLGSFLGLTAVVGVWRRVRRRESGNLHQNDTGDAVSAASLQCSGCGKRLKAKADLAGKKVKCPGCGQALQVPDAGPATPQDAGGATLAQPRGPAWVRGLLLLLCAAAGAGAVLAGVWALEDTSETVHDFRGETLPPGAKRFGPDADRCVLAKPDGLHLTLPKDRKDAAPVGLILPVELWGDFQVTTTIEILQADEPKAGYGVGVLLGLKHSVRLGRLVRPDGEQVVLWDRNTTPGQGIKLEGEAFPCSAQVLRLRMQRIAGNLQFLWAPEIHGADFEEIHRCDFAEDVKLIKLIAQTNRQPCALDVRVLDLRIGAAAENAAHFHWLAVAGMAGMGAMGGGVAAWCGLRREPRQKAPG